MPATQRQIDANRRNAAGPHKMSEAGKAAVRLNALTHGLTAQPQLILPGEDSEAYNQLRDTLLADYAPASGQEKMLVLQIAENFWRLLRARNMETGALSTTLIEQRRQLGVRSDPARDPELSGQLALAYTKHDKVFSRLGRYETTIERSYYPRRSRTQ